MKRYLVISLDNDEQQWFYDHVFAEDEEAAKRRILDIRPYVIDADAIDLPELRTIARNLGKRKRKDVEAFLHSIAVDSGVAERPDLSHDSDCAYRLKGECTCGKDSRREVA